MFFVVSNSNPTGGNGHFKETLFTTEPNFEVTLTLIFIYKGGQIFGFNCSWLRLKVGNHTSKTRKLPK